MRRGVTGRDGTRQDLTRNQEDDVEEKKRAIQETSVDTRLLYQRLQSMGPAEEISYEDLSAVIDRDVRNGARHNMESARHMAQRIDGMIFDCVRGVGLKRLDDSGIVKTADSRMKRIRGQARRGVKALACATGELGNDDLIKHNAAMSIMGAILHATKQKTRNLIERKVADIKESLPLAKTLRLFGDRT